MDTLFTPWRRDYLTGARDEGGCVFCEAAAPSPDRDAERLVLHRRASLYVILNLYPYTSGHLMIVPNRHLARLDAATPDERRDLIETAALCERLLEQTYRPGGLNLGLNLGRAAGAGIVGHLHLHVVPRWEGDTNFATVIGGTRVVPETPAESYARLAPLFAALA